jgi:hypothetical protein
VARRVKLTDEQALLVYLKLSDDDIGEEEEENAILSLELQLERMIREQGLGTYDWHEVGGGYYKLFMYGPDADKLFRTVLPSLLGFPAMPGSFATLRYGGQDARARIVELSSRPLPAQAADAVRITFGASEIRH